jgi:ribosomal protein S18 acetylase RimI-like enzyme
MAIRYRSVLDYGIEPSAALVTRGFSDYFVPITLTGASLLTMVRQDSVDLESSRIAFLDDVPVGVAFIARRGWTTRLAAMALVPEARQQGVGEHCVRLVMDEARARGERTMVLEVIEQNDRARRLYERCGFRIVGRLVGFEGAVTGGSATDAPVPVDVHEVARALIAHGPTDLPWQLSGETLGQAVPPATGYRSEHAWIAISDPAAPKVNVRALVTVPEARRRGAASSLLRAVMAQHPDRTWRVPAIWPEQYGGLFEKLGLPRSELTQWLMSAALTA